jgi:hypothetical protein
MDCSCSLKSKIAPEISAISTTGVWSARDYLGAIKVRMSAGRNRYSVVPGLYRLGSPDKNSEVFVTANYKLSFDILRKNLSGLNVWILVLDTKGINVWCAAGKGTFGTNELIKKIDETKLHDIVQHRRIIVPQLGAPGVSAYQVKKVTGFNVKFGPVLARDIKRYLFSKYQADESMRTVPFGFMDRLILTPVEIVNSLKYLAVVLLVMGIVMGTGFNRASVSFSFDLAIIAALFTTASYLSGAFLTPIFLPWIPSRYFSMKGIFVGTSVFLATLVAFEIELSLAATVGWLLLSVAISSFLAMNFTGASTYTSLSGVKKEMKIFVPVQISLSFIGLVMIVISKFLEL